MRRSLAVSTTLVVALACSSFSDDEAVALVRRYNARVIEAYRTADVRLVEPLVGDAQAKKLTGLIGVKSDQGVTLDARLVEFEPVGVERREGAVVVSTRERWYYRDRRIGTGEQVGQDSTDRYAMRYWLRRPAGRWVVERIEFAAPPEVGRSETMNRAEVGAMHGVQSFDPMRSTGANGGPEARER